VFHYKGEKMAVASANTDLHGYGRAIRLELSRRLPSGRKLRVLDVGSGFGINAAFLARSLPKGSEVWTVDPSPEVLDNAKKSLGADAARLRFREASAHDLGFDEGYFDAVVSVMVLHHVVALQPAIAEMARVLRPGGTLLAVDYKPEASHKLDFKSRHEEKDFFSPEAVARGMAMAGLEAAEEEHGVWYLVEGRKAASARRRRAGRAPSRVASGR